jgi:hypothetical protein
MYVLPSVEASSLGKYWNLYCLGRLWGPSGCFPVGLWEDYEAGPSFRWQRVLAMRIANAVTVTEKGFAFPPDWPPLCPQGLPCDICDAICELVAYLS